VLGVSLLAGLEYAQWRTKHDEGGWTYRLPTDLEWEKAARGADRRIYVWGDYPLWSYCSSLKATYLRPVSPSHVGSFPTDESPFGVRDMAGSVFEVTTGRTQNRYRYTALRGGNWRTSDDRFFRICSRNGRNPEAAEMDSGLRLVVDPGTRSAFEK
jgi:formylglycine-generating enzyme required for sulfatase activity